MLKSKRSPNVVLGGLLLAGYLEMGNVDDTGSVLVRLSDRYPGKAHLNPRDSGEAASPQLQMLSNASGEMHAPEKTTMFCCRFLRAFYPKWRMFVYTKVKRLRFECTSSCLASAAILCAEDQSAPSLRPPSYWLVVTGAGCHFLSVDWLQMLSCVQNHAYLILIPPEGWWRSLTRSFIVYIFMSFMCVLWVFGHTKPRVVFRCAHILDITIRFLNKSAFIRV